MNHILIDNKIVLSGCLIINDKKEILLLFRKDHKHYETPGGKVEASECLDPNNPSIDELRKTAEREVFEELGNNIRISKPEYFGKVEFVVPDGRKAFANKFITKIISGEPIVAEPDIFEKFDYLQINKLQDYPISPDLRLFLKKYKLV